MQIESIIGSIAQDSNTSEGLLQTHSESHTENFADRTGRHTYRRRSCADCTKCITDR
jgi:hypothetical protein